MLAARAPCFAFLLATGVGARPENDLWRGGQIAECLVFGFHVATCVLCKSHSPIFLLEHTVAQKIGIEYVSNMYVPASQEHTILAS